MIRGITTCQVPTGPNTICGKVFTGPTYALIGQGKHQEVVQYMNEIQQHFLKAHPAESEATQNRSLEFLTMLRLLNFKTTDSELRDQCQFLRWQIAQQVIPIRLRDEKLKGMAAQYAAEIVDLFIAEIGAALGANVLSLMPKGKLDALKISARKKIADKTVTTIGELRDLYEEPNRYNIEVVPIEKPAEPEKTSKTPLLIVP
jgi:hypothetical protein